MSLIDCKGSVIVSDSSGSFEKRFNATKVRNARKKRHIIQEKIFVHARLEGDCCWKAWSSNRGPGEFHHLTFPKQYLPFDGQAIRSIEFLGN